MHRINRILAKEVDAIPHQYFTAGPIKQSTSPYSSPLVVIPNRYGGVRIPINYNKLNDISRPTQLPTPRVDQVLGSLGKGRVSSLFDLVWSVHQTMCQKETFSFTVFCTTMGLCE